MHSKLGAASSDLPPVICLLVDLLHGLRNGAVCPGAVFLACPDASGSTLPAPVGTPQAPPPNTCSAAAQDPAGQLSQAAPITEGKQPAADGKLPFSEGKPGSRQSGVPSLLFIISKKKAGFTFAQGPANLSQTACRTSFWHGGNPEHFCLFMFTSKS